MSTINLRIAELVQYFSNGNNSDFGNKIGVNEANIRNYINGTEPKFSFLEKICNNFEISSEWLLTGNPPMLLSEVVNEPAVSSSLPQENDKYTALLEKQVAQLEKINALQEEKIKGLEKEVAQLKEDLELYIANSSGDILKSNAG